MARKRTITVGSDEVGVVIAIRLTPAMIAALDIAAVKVGKKRSEVMRDILVSWLLDREYL